MSSPTRPGMPRSTTKQRRQSLCKASWLPDRQAKSCMASQCNTTFSLRERRHHCRLCGKIFCSIHTGYTKLATEPASSTTSSTTSASSSSSFLDSNTSRTLSYNGTSLSAPSTTSSNSNPSSSILATPQSHHQMVRVCNDCFLSVHDSEQIHEADERVPVGFICYVPYGPPYMTGPGGLGNLRDIDKKTDKPFHSARIMPRARSVVVKRVELSHKAKGPVFVLLVTGRTIGRLIQKRMESVHRVYGSTVD